MADLTGTTFLNRYRVDAFIGRGGMGDVYLVWDIQRSVPLALKLLHDDYAEDRVFIRRFHREAATLSKLQHPHIVRFYGLEEDHGRVFLLMDFVDGISLRREIAQAQKPLTELRVLQLLQPVCAALHYAHNVGFVHCDVKPANIMIHRNGTVFVADFGIARMTEGATTVTMVGAGTPAYMAPEQIRGESPTPQTDIYSLGIVLYEMLTGGERPFTGEVNGVTGSTGEKVRWEHVHKPAPSMRSFNPQIRPEVDAVVLRCLEKDPARRFPNALAVFQALQSAFGIVSIPQAQVAARPTEYDTAYWQTARSSEPGAKPQAPVKMPSPALNNQRSKSRVLPALLMGIGAVILLVIGSLFMSALMPKPEFPLQPSQPAAQKSQPTSTARSLVSGVTIPTVAPSEPQATPSETAASREANPTVEQQSLPHPTDTPPPTQTSKPRYWVEVAVSQIYLYEGPDIRYPVVSGGYPRGAELEAIGRYGNEWMLLRGSDSRTGWAYYDWLAYSFSIYDLPVVDNFPPLPAPTPTPTKAVKPKRYP